MAVEFRVLGPLEVCTDDGAAPLDVGGYRQRRLLARLLVDAGAVVSTVELIDAVWPEPDRPPAADRSLRTYVSRLRRSFAEAEPGADPIVTIARGYQVQLNGHRFDSNELVELAGGVRRALEDGDPAGAVEPAERALRLWRGRPYPEVDGEPWALGEVRRLCDVHAELVEDRFDALLALGRHRELTGELERAVADRPERPRRCGQLMLALHRSGRQADALRAFQEHRRWLAEQTGLEPTPELCRLEQRIAAGDEALAAGEPEGRRLRAYRLQERIGEGSFALVWRGVQPSLGREVAVKQIRAELANQPEFIRRFETEAHLVARLEHPHIVPLYDYWREPGSAYLVMRWLRGGTLEDRAAERPLSAEECVRLVTQVGDALGHAHRAGVVHRDVKSANVLLDGDGNFFLGDFGIALEAVEATGAGGGSLASLSAGSPAYASPEQLQRRPVAPSADVHGLGIVLYEALTGQLPFPDERTRAGLLQRQLHDAIPPVRARRLDLPPGVDDVLRRATAKQPSDRYASAAELVDAFVEAMGGGGPLGRAGTRGGIRGASTLVTGAGTNPYKGLRAFTEADAADFAGRSRLVDRLVEHLNQPDVAGRLLAVVGPSGSGKSSLVRAGLLPAVRAGRVRGGERWFVTTMVPGAHPFEELEAALGRVAADGERRWVEVLAADERGISRATKGVLADGDAELLLVVDQFEELFTLVDDEAVRARFLRSLCAAVTDPRSRLRLVLSLRADFWDRPLRYPELAALLDGGAVPVGPLAPDELERAIVDPAVRAGGEFEPGLVSEIVADVADQPGALPMLQYALTELFERQVSGLLRVEAYRQLGGVAGALAGRAEELFADSSDSEQAAGRRLFTRLVTLGEGVEDTRRRVVRSELGDDPAMAAVIERYGRARLLSFDRDPSSREPTVEVAHEALIRQWPRLRAWLDEDRAGLRVHRQLTEATRSWDQAGRDDSELYRGARLDVALDWADAHPGDPNPGEASFLAASRERRDSEAARERRQVRRLRTALVAAGVVAVVALLAGALAAVQQRRASRNADLAAQRADDTAAALGQSTLSRLQAESKALAATDRRLAMLLALEANRLEDSIPTQSTVLNSLVVDPRFEGVLPGFEGSTTLALDVDGGTLRTVSDAAVLQEWDLASRQLTRTIPLPGTPSTQGVVLGRQYVVYAKERAIEVVDLSVTPPALRRIEHRLQNTAQQHLAFSADERTIYLAGIDDIQPSAMVGRALGFDLASGAPSGFSVIQGTSINATARVGDRLITGGIVDRRLGVWDLASGAAVGEPWAVAAGSLRIVPSPDGTRIAVASPFPVSVTVFDLASRQVVAGPFAPSAPGTTNVGLAFSPDGNLLAVQAQEGRADLWDLRTGKAATTALDANGGGQQWVAFSGDGTRLVTASLAPTVFAVDGSINLSRRLPVAGGGGTWNHDGSRLAVNNRTDHNVSLYDGTTLQHLATTPSGPVDRLFPGGFGPLTSFSPDGSLLAVGYNGTLVHLYDGRTGAPVATPLLEAAKLLPTPRLAVGPTTGLAWSADGRRLAISGWAGVWVVDVASRQVLVDRFRLNDRIASLEAFLDPTGTLLYATELGGSVLATLEVDTGQRRPDISHEGFAGRANFFDLSPDGSTLAIPAGSGLVQLWAVPEGRLVRELRTHNETVAIVRFSRDGRQLWAIAQSSTSKLVDLASGAVYEPGFADLGGNGAGMQPFTPDGRQVALGSMSPLGSGLLLVDIDPEVWKRRACELAGRNLTAAEWATYLPTGGPHRKTCEQWPLDRA